MDDKTFGVVSTISGLVIGWSLTELSSSFKSKKENKQILNQILFTQLEIRDIIKKTNLDAVEEHLTNFFLKNYPTMDITLINETMGKIFYGFIQNELNTKFSYKIKELIHGYKSYINDLSKIDPFTTYYISNKDLIFDYLDYINKYLSSIEPYLDQPLIAKNELQERKERTFGVAFSDIKDKITPFIRETALDTIEKDIKLIAKKSGLLKYFKTISHLKRTKLNKFDVADIKKIENYLSTLK